MLNKQTLAPCDKLHEGTDPNMLLYTLDKFCHVFKKMVANDLNVYEILSFALLHCMEWRGKPINPHKTCRDMSTMVDVGN